MPLFTQRKLEIMSFRSLRTPLTVAIAAVCAIVATACSAPNGGSGSAQNSAPGGVKATGTPVVVGFYNQTNSTMLNFPEITDGTNAAVEYINNELGGVGGHPIQLVSCATAGTPESSQNCAHQIVEKNPVAVLVGADFNQATANPILVNAGLAQIAGAPLQVTDSSMKDSFFLSPGTIGFLPAEAKFAAQVLRAKRVGIIYDTPTVKAAMPFITGPLDQAGVSHVEVDASASTDYTGPVNALNPGGLDAIITVLGSSTGCINFAQAYAAQNSKTPVIALSTCRAPDVVKAVNAQENGFYYIGPWEEVTNQPTPDVKTSVDALGRYSTAAPSGLLVAAFEQMMTLRTILQATGADTTPAKLVQFMSTQSGKIFGGPSWKCGEIPAFPALCSTESRFYQVQGDTVVPADNGQYIDAADVLSAIPVH